MKRTPWIERRFSFDFPEGWMTNILERLRGTEARLLNMTHLLLEQDVSFKPNGKWSIKEHVGHLCDLEELHEGRIDDFIDRKAVLRAADMQNTKTYSADHNQRELNDLINQFKIKRNMLVYRLEQLDDDTQIFKALHPRLQVDMRPVDMAYFTAEHDDHHLASIREILMFLKK